MEIANFGAEFGKLLRFKRGIEGLSQDDLSGLSGISKSRISLIETGKVANPQTRVVDPLCVALNISRDERVACYPSPKIVLPARLIEKLAQNFDEDMPDADESELEAFLVAKSEEFNEMRQRLKLLAKTQERVSELITAADVALGEGEFDIADRLLNKAEAVQFESSTVVALRAQATIRIERGNASLMGGDISAANQHFEVASLYFSGLSKELEAESRFECVKLLRFYGYRYSNCEALSAAHAGLTINLGIWDQCENVERWCETKNALGGVCLRLAQFDDPENEVAHLTESKGHHEDVRKVCSENFLPERYGSAAINLANVLSMRRLADSEEAYYENLHTSLELELSALQHFAESENPEAWGVIQHNLGCAYINLSKIREHAEDSATDLENAIVHAELSFRVRNPEDSLQFWVASCRTLGEAFVNMSKLPTVNDSDVWVSRARDVLNRAAEAISAKDHPHQWAELQQQLDRCV